MPSTMVRIGSDNVCDITSPMGSVNMLDELLVLGNTMRYYDIDFLSRLAAGKRLDADGMARLKTHLIDNDEMVDEVVQRFAPEYGR